MHLHRTSWFVPPGRNGWTLGRHVFIRKGLTPERERRLVRHEGVHVRQYEEHGIPKFLTIYVKDYLRNRLAGMDHDEAYRAIPFEVEAREAE